MKTARERAVDWLAEALTDNSLSMADSLELLLKEQDKITRHACAEKMLTIRTMDSVWHCDAILPEDAHDACINVKAV